MAWFYPPSNIDDGLVSHTLAHPCLGMALHFGMLDTSADKASACYLVWLLCGRSMAVGWLCAWEQTWAKASLLKTEQ